MGAPAKSGRKAHCAADGQALYATRRSHRCAQPSSSPLCVTRLTAGRGLTTYTEDGLITRPLRVFYGGSMSQKKMIAILVGAIMMLACTALVASTKVAAGQNTVNFTAPTLVGGTVLPAGQYSVTHEMNGQTHAMIFKQVGGKKAERRPTVPGTAEGESGTNYGTLGDQRQAAASAARDHLFGRSGNARAGAIALIDLGQRRLSQPPFPCLAGCGAGSRSAQFLNDRGEFLIADQAALVNRSSLDRLEHHRTLEIPATPTPVPWPSGARYPDRSSCPGQSLGALQPTRQRTAR